MAAFIFFSTVWRRLRSQPPTGAPQLFRGSDFNIDGNDPGPGDRRGSEEILLDLQMRRFFRREYGQAQPPESAFARLVQATTQYTGPLRGTIRNTQYAIRSRFPSLTEAAYRALTGQLTARILSSSVALVVLLAVLGANASQLLVGGQDEVQRDTPAFELRHAASPEEWRERLEAKDAEQPTPQAAASPSMAYGQVDPVDDLIMTSPHRPLKHRNNVEQQDLVEPPLMVGSQF